MTSWNQIKPNWALSFIALSAILVSVACAPKSEQTLPPGADQSSPRNQLQGGQDAGGGKGVKCGPRVSTLDLYEAEFIRHEAVSFKAQDVDEALINSAFKLGIHLNDQTPEPATEGYKSKFATLIKDDIYGRFEYLQAGQRLTFTDDATLSQLPKGCSFIQIASYEKNGKLLVDREYWTALRPEDQAALLLHEWLYRRERESGRKLNSDETRRVVSMFFTPNTSEPMFSTIWKTRRLSCYGGGGAAPYNGELYEFYIVDDIEAGKPGVRFHFRHAKSRLLMSRTTGFAPGLSIDDIREGNFSPINLVVDSVIVPKPWAFEFQHHKTNGSGSLHYKFSGHYENEAVPTDSLGSCDLENSNP